MIFSKRYVEAGIFRSTSTGPILKMKLLETCAQTKTRTSIEVLEIVIPK